VGRTLEQPTAMSLRPRSRSLEPSDADPGRGAAIPRRGACGPRPPCAVTPVRPLSAVTSPYSDSSLSCMCCTPRDYTHIKTYHATIARKTHEMTPMCRLREVIPYVIPGSKAARGLMYNQTANISPQPATRASSWHRCTHTTCVACGGSRSSEAESRPTEASRA